MSDGRTTRVAVLLALLVLAPLVGAVTPANNRPTADGTDGQDISDLAMDPSGQFIAAVVVFDSAKGTTSVGGVPGLGGTPATGSNNHKDLYVCDYGVAPSSGTQCRGLKHAIGTLETNTPSYPQKVDATFHDRQGKYAVAGPDGRVSLWTHTSDSAAWSTSVQNNRNALNITIAPDASRVVVGAAGTTGSGTIEVRFGENGTLVWELPLTNAASAGVRPTSLDYARSGNVLAIGTSDGLLLANPALGVPSGQLGGISQVGAVNKVLLSADGQYVVASASNGIFLAQVIPGSKPTVSSASVFNRGFSENGASISAQDAAISADGTRFAAAAGNLIYFFRRLDTGAVAEPVGQPYDAKARVTSIAYDEKGSLLVAVAGNTVFGFGPNTNDPLWSFDATLTNFGSVDGPLRKVAVSDDAQRIVVAGKTKTMSYNNLLGVGATLTAANTELAPTQTIPLILNVTNNGSLSDNYSFVISPPQGWPSASAPTLRLDPGRSQDVGFNITAPTGQAPGVYGVQVQIRSQAAEELALRRNQIATPIPGPSLNLRIPRSVVLNVSIADERLNLRQGGEQTVVVTLRNEGNADGIVNLSIQQSAPRGSWDVQFEGGPQVRVPASGVTPVNMIVRVPSDSGGGDVNTITVTAKEGDTTFQADSIIVTAGGEYRADLKANRTPPSYEFYPGQTQRIVVNITNQGNTEDVFNLTSTVTPSSVANDWRVDLEKDQIALLRGETKSFTVNVKAVATDTAEASLTIRSISQRSPDKTENSILMSLTAIPRPPVEEKNDKLLPAPGIFVTLVVLVGLALRTRGGRR